MLSFAAALPVFIPSVRVRADWVFPHSPARFINALYSQNLNESSINELRTKQTFYDQRIAQPDPRVFDLDLLFCEMVAIGKNQHT